MKGPDFIGLGAQKSGTSWIYACLHEHPEICVPRKEIHFFSRERNWSKGYEWYISNFTSCTEGKITGEFSTSYLVDEHTPERIYNKFPNVKLIISIRNPIDRAYSNYVNDIKTGAVHNGTNFLDALKTHPEYIKQGFYADQIIRYLSYFQREQLLILLYEDSLRMPEEFIRNIYRFLGVDDSLVPEFIRTRINFARIPRHVWIDKMLRDISGLLRSRGLDTIFWNVKKSGMADKIRALNTRTDSIDNEKINDDTRKLVYEAYDIDNEITEVSRIIGRDLAEWRI